jgi:hypothetical protein
MSEQAVGASMASEHDVNASMSAGAGAAIGGLFHAVRAAGPEGGDVVEGDDLDDDVEDDLDDDLDDDDDDDDDDDLDEFEDDELDDDEDDDDEADEIDFTEDRYGRIPGEDDADV